MPEFILGLSAYYHDSAAALLADGRIIAAAHEERFTRKKHDINFPINAINYCLKSQNITIKDIDYIGFYEKPFLKFERLLSQHLEMFPLSFKVFVSSTPLWITRSCFGPCSRSVLHKWVMSAPASSILIASSAV